MLHLGHQKLLWFSFGWQQRIMQLLSLLPPPGWDGEENHEEKAKDVTWDENGLTE